MSILNKLSKKRQQPEFSDTFNVVLKTEKDLSEEQKNTIINIVKNGIIFNVEFRDIALNIMRSTDIYDMIILNRIDNGVEVIF